MFNWHHVALVFCNVFGQSTAVFKSDHVFTTTDKMKYLLLLLAIVCFVVQTYATDVNTDLLIEDLDRSIDTSNNNVVRQDIRVTLVNGGSVPATVFHFALPKQYADDHLSLVTVSQSDKQLSVSAGHTNANNK
jgi:hypothetical protein